MSQIELKNFCAALYESCILNKPEEFQVWKSLWIANNGQIGRKKEVSTTSLIDVLGAKSVNEIDPYTYVFAIESALIYLADQMKKGFGICIKKGSASDIFRWWQGNLQEHEETLAEKIGHEITLQVLADPVSFICTDPFRGFYHDLLPKAIRHTLGAYLTPRDLCDFVIDDIGFKQAYERLEPSILEPNCGLGAFICALFRVVNQSIARGESTRTKGLSFFLSKFFGIEKNVASAEISAALWSCIIKILGGNADDVECQVYCGDSIFISEAEVSRRLLKEELFEMPELTAAGILRFETGTQGRVTAVLDDESWIDVDASMNQALEHLPAMQAQVQSLLNRDAKKIASINRVDFIIGNPPWINWENIDPAYRTLLLPSWPKLGLFAMAGRDRSFSKEDLSVFATYSACLRFGGKNTRVCLLLPQSIFQSRKNSKGFRRFRLGATGAFLKIIRVTDFSDYIAFGDAKNRTAALSFQIGETPTEYPVDYWKYTSGKSEKGIDTGKFDQMRAQPSTKNDMTSNWALYGEKEEITTEKRTVGIYRARTGVFTGGANAIFYIRVIDARCDLLYIENDTDRAKIKVPTQRLEIERDAVWPFMKGRDLAVWSSTRPEENGIILLHSAQTKIKPLSEYHVQAYYPSAFSYLSQFRQGLETRGSLTALDRANVAEGFYALLRVGEYTFAPYKVAWRYIAKSFICAVIPPTRIGNIVRPTILQEKLISIPFWDEDEAYFVCGYLTSSQMTAEIERRIVGTQVSVHVIEDLHIPKYIKEEPLHKKISSLCKDGHQAGGITPAIAKELDILVAQIQTAK